MKEPSVSHSTVAIQLDAIFSIKKGWAWWPPTRDRYISNRLNTLNPLFAWTDSGLEYKIFRQQRVPYPQISEVSLFPLKRLVQRGQVVSSTRTGIVVAFAGQKTQLLAVPSTPSLLRQAIEQARLHGCPLDADALALLDDRART